MQIIAGEDACSLHSPTWTQNNDQSLPWINSFTLQHVYRQTAADFSHFEFLPGYSCEEQNVDLRMNVFLGSLSQQREQSSHKKVIKRLQYICVWWYNAALTAFQRGLVTMLWTRGFLRGASSSSLQLFVLVWCAFPKAAVKTNLEMDSHFSLLF